MEELVTCLSVGNRGDSLKVGESLRCQKQQPGGRCCFTDVMYSAGRRRDATEAVGDRTGGPYQVSLKTRVFPHMLFI